MGRNRAATNEEYDSIVSEIERLQKKKEELEHTAVVYGYARVSSRGQARDGTSLENQEQELRKAGAEEIFMDVATGRTTDRPELNQLLDELESGDTLIVTKLDRIARSVSEGSELIQHLLNKGVAVNVLNLGKIDSTASGKLLMNIFLSFAEFERDMIFERTQEGKAASGNYGGRPKKFSKQQIVLAMELLGTHSYSQVSEMTGISVSTLVREKKEKKRETSTLLNTTNVTTRRKQARPDSKGTGKQQEYTGLVVKDEEITLEGKR